MTRKNRLSTEEHRLYWLDNLRTFMIFLVVVLHAGLVYESSGIPAFFWIVDDPSTNDLYGILNLIIDIFVMPTIFFISGFFVPPSMRARKGSSFLRAKFNRLMIPWVVSVLTLIPLYKVIFLYSRNLPQEHWTTYFHWSNGIWGQNWLWFLPVLFLFNALYVLFSRVNISPAADSPKKTVGAIVLVGCFYAVCMDVLGLQGWTKTVLIDFQNERVLIYFLVFLSGSLCHKLGTFKSERKGKRLYVFLACTASAGQSIPIPGHFLADQARHRPDLYCAVSEEVFAISGDRTERFHICSGNKAGALRGGSGPIHTHAL